MVKGFWPTAWFMTVDKDDVPHLWMSRARAIEEAKKHHWFAYRQNDSDVFPKVSLIYDPDLDVEFSGGGRRVGEI